MAKSFEKGGSAYAGVTAMLQSATDAGSVRKSVGVPASVSADGPCLVYTFQAFASIIANLLESVDSLTNAAVLALLPSIGFGGTDIQKLRGLALSTAWLQVKAASCSTAELWRLLADWIQQDVDDGATWASSRVCARPF